MKIRRPPHVSKGGAFARAVKPSSFFFLLSFCKPSPLLDGVRHQPAFDEVGVAVTHLRLHQVLPLDRRRNRSRAFNDAPTKKKWWEGGGEGANR